jgi:hypothetical protein
MSILIGLLLYALCIAWLCALTGANRLDGPQHAPKRQLEEEPSEVATAASAASASQAHG